VSFRDRFDASTRPLTRELGITQRCCIVTSAKEALVTAAALTEGLAPYVLRNEWVRIVFEAMSRVGINQKYHWRLRGRTFFDCAQAAPRLRLAGTAGARRPRTSRSKLAWSLHSSVFSLGCASGFTTAALRKLDRLPRSVRSGLPGRLSCGVWSRSRSAPPLQYAARHLINDRTIIKGVVVPVTRLALSSLRTTGPAASLGERALLARARPAAPYTRWPRVPSPCPAAPRPALEAASDALRATMSAMNWTATGTGDRQALRVAIGKVIEAGDEFPFPAHAPMEPLNAAVRMNADGDLEIWGVHPVPGQLPGIGGQGGRHPAREDDRTLRAGHSEKELACWARWGEFARTVDVRTQMLTPEEAAQRGRAAGKLWKGGVFAPSDGIASPCRTPPTAARAFLDLAEQCIRAARRQASRLRVAGSLH
jgi:hypothetical protein